MAETIEGLRAEVERLQRLVDQAKPPARAKFSTVEFLGEEISGDMVQELASGGKLSATFVRTNKMGSHGDGRNLWLQVTSGGGRSWLFRYMRDGKAREMGIGSTKEVSLAEARARAAICRRLLRAGADPIERRKEIDATKALAAPKLTTFKAAAGRYINSHKAGWKSEKHAAQWTATLESYAYEALGEMPVQTVDTDHVMKVLEPIWSEKAETASRVRGRIELVLDWATAMKLRKGENPARWRGHLDKLLPRRSKVQKVKHHPALPYADMGAFWRDLSRKEGMSAEALRFLILTGMRSGEVIGARWAEIDLVSKIWAIPASRMKAEKEHRVPLSEPAIELLNRVKQADTKNEGFVFPGGGAAGPLSGAAMAMLLRGMNEGKGGPQWVDPLQDNREVTPHGFRSTFRDWAAETTAYPNEMVEMALAHAVSDKVEAAYRRGDMFARRKRLMEDWATFAQRVPAPKADNVSQIGKARA